MRGRHTRVAAPTRIEAPTEKGLKSGTACPGAGYSSGSLTVNVAGIYVPEAKLSGANAAQGISSYEVKMSQITFDLGVAYRF